MSSQAAIIRPASKADIIAITSLVESALLLHRNLDWQPLVDFVEREPFLLRFEGNSLQALLSCAPDPVAVAWIHAFAVRGWSEHLEQVWRSLLDPSIEILKTSASRLYTISMNDWYTRLLNASGFRVFQRIIVLQLQDRERPGLPPPPGMIIRPMELADLEGVFRVDQAAFAPAWVLSRRSLELTYLNAQHTSVAEMDGEVVGYEVTTANHFSAHLVRLAVLPTHTHENIGYTLAYEMHRYFLDRRIRNITVNTQEDNLASISLYKKLGYAITPEKFPVYTLDNYL